MSNLPALATVDTFIDQVICCEAETLARSLPDNSINAVICSPPYYGLRSYLPDDHAEKGREIGLEDTPAAYVERLVAVFREIRRVLRPDGVCWLNLGDSYAGSGRGLMGDGTPSDRGDAKQGTNRGTTVGVFNKPDWDGLAPKNLIGIPWRVAFALQADGWWLRSDIIWHKPNPMPESVTDRPTRAHEYVFLLTKSERYWYDADAIREPLALPDAADGTRIFGGKHKNGANVAHARTTGRAYDAAPDGRNKRTVWTVPTEPKPFSHFAMFPQALIEPMVLAGCPAQVCSACGAPYERVVEREVGAVNLREGKQQALRSNGAQTGGTQRVTLGVTEQVTRTTLGFRPTCDCHAEPRPGIVYDPFMGGGTTALVAQRLGRHFVGTDINREYVELARKRVQYRGDDRRMMREQEAGVEQIALFEDGAA